LHHGLAWINTLPFRDNLIHITIEILEYLASGFDPCTNPGIFGNKLAAGLPGDVIIDIVMADILLQPLLDLTGRNDHRF
jgi:hypothetical protein